MKFNDPEYTPGAPSDEIAEMDARIAEKIVCPYCGTRCDYEAWQTEGSYTPLAVCAACGWDYAF